MNETINILIVEDDEDINNLLKNILTKQGYNVHCAYSGTEAMMCLMHYSFHMILLDLMLPGITGEELISNIRKTSTMPILVISAKPGQDIKVQVLKYGADDFIAKPFDVNEVLARVDAQLRRYLVFSSQNKETKVLSSKNLTLNCETLEVMLSGQEVNLTAREFRILELLMSHPSKVFTKSNIFEHVWNDEFLGDENTVNVHISNLRNKLSKVDSENEYIHTVWGIGFKLT